MLQEYFIDISKSSLNKKEEELCGDKVEIIKREDRIIVVMSDGLGSGVKANILATLTSKIMITMLEKGATLLETIETITKTLPICNVRKIGYSTFSVIDIDENLNAKIIEFDNPPAIVVRDRKLFNLKKEKLHSSGKDVWVSSVKLKVGDEITMCSDGVIHAGVGQTLNYGWEWEHVAEFLENQKNKSASTINRRLIDTCNSLYNGKPGDDTTAVTLVVRTPEEIQILTGPPEDKSLDKEVVDDFINRKGKKIVCGGTAANIVSRELNREIITNLDYLDPNIPPTATIHGIDLVTEGVLTLKMVLENLKEIRSTCGESNFEKADGVSKLLKLMVDDSTHIYFWVGRAINPAHQNPDFPKDLSIKSRIINEIIEELKLMGKTVYLNYTD